MSSLTELVESSQENISGDVLMGAKCCAQAWYAAADSPSGESDKMWISTSAPTLTETYITETHTHKQTNKQSTNTNTHD